MRPVVTDPHNSKLVIRDAYIKSHKAQEIMGRVVSLSYSYYHDRWDDEFVLFV